MRVFAETNFLLTLLLDQRDAEHAARLLTAADTGRTALFLPAFSVAEAYRVVRGRQKQVLQFRDDLARCSAKLLESRNFRSAAGANVARLRRELTNQPLREAAALRRLRDRLRVATLIPLTPEVVNDARAVEEAAGLDPLDTTVLASVEAVCRADPATGSVFVTTNRHDFDVPAVRERLAAAGCDLLTGFGSAAGRIDADGDITAPPPHTS